MSFKRREMFRHIINRPKGQVDIRTMSSINYLMTINVAHLTMLLAPNLVRRLHQQHIRIVRPKSSNTMPMPPLDVPQKLRNITLPPTCILQHWNVLGVYNLEMRTR
jgi:hypothetical protein